MTFRAAVIGCGRIGSEYADDPRITGIYTHAGAYVSCSQTELAGLSDIDAARLARCGERWGVEARYRDYRDLLEEVRPEIVSICTPDETHAGILRAVLTAPGVRAVLVEKPLATTLADAGRLARLAREQGVILAVNYSRRYAPSHRRVRDLVRGGGIGGIQSMCGYYSKGCLHSGTHWFDLARFLIGEIMTVWGFDVLEEGGPDPTLDAMLTFASGAVGYLRGCDDRSFSIFEADILGTTGRIRILESGHRVDLFAAGESPHYSGYRSLRQQGSAPEGFDNLLLYAVEDLVRCLTQGGEPACTGEDGVAALRVALATHRSARNGRAVSLGGMSHA
jgi:predicted dehydrogenase